MYLWVPLPEGVESEPWARRLLLEQGVALLPGKSLGEGGEGFVRIALTCSEDRLRAGGGAHGEDAGAERGVTAVLGAISAPRG